VVYSWQQMHPANDCQTTDDTSVRLQSKHQNITLKLTVLSVLAKPKQHKLVSIINKLTGQHLHQE
jgi:hypothetical protein